MPTQRHIDVLRTLTSLPTAAGCEERVIAFVEAWAGRHKRVTLKRDKYGNIELRRKGARSTRPIYFTAHMDHPAFVVTSVSENGKTVHADFRGGVKEAFFVGTRVRWWPANETDHAAASPGRVVAYSAAASRSEDPNVEVHFTKATAARPGDVLTWDLKPSSIKGGRLHAPVCDDLAAMAAALAAFESFIKPGKLPDVRVLLTRCEELAFIGAMGACRSGIIPRGARLIALENSKSFAESPIGGGPIVRVGDRMSTFSPELTYRVSQVAERLQAKDATFCWQRKLMPGGTCEATAFQAFSYDATCVCLPLGNYHNMDADRGRIAHEIISTDDYTHLIQFLIAIGHDLDATDGGMSLKTRLDKLFANREHLIA